MRVLETTLGQAASAAEAAGIGAPAIVCVGRNVLLRQAIDWAGQLAGGAPRSLDPLGTRDMADTA
jgi:uroporphyrin-III C-methyltransferase